MTSSSHNYSADVLSSDWRRRTVPTVELELDMVVEEAVGGFCGAVVSWTNTTVTLEDRRDRQRVFPLVSAGFQVDGALVTLTVPIRAGQQRPARTASGSIAMANAPAQVAKASRIYVEGIHDAELVERIWGDDLRIEGIVVEPLHGIDDLPGVIRDFVPGPQRRLGVLVDHLIPGSKESRIVADCVSANVAITGHPYVDIWQAIKPARLGITQWPSIARGLDWKTGICAELGWENPAAGWRRIRAAVTTYTDLEPPLLAAVEELIDFVTGADRGD